MCALSSLPLFNGHIKNASLLALLSLSTSDRALCTIFSTAFRHFAHHPMFATPAILPFSCNFLFLSATAQKSMQYKMHAGGIGLFSGLHCTFCLLVLCNGVCMCGSVCVSVHEWVFAREYISWKFKVGTCVCMLLHSGHLQQTKHPLWASTFRGFCHRCRSTRVLHVSTMPNGNKVLQPALLHHPHLVPPALWGIERAHYGRYLFTQ